MASRPGSDMHKESDMTAEQPFGTVDKSIDPSLGQGEIVFLSWVPEERIPPLHRKYVRRHVDRLARENGLPPVTIKWFGPPLNGGDFWGVAPFAAAMPGGVAPSDMENTVAFHYALRGADVLLPVIAHEICHLVQRRDGRPSDHEEATRYGVEYAARMAA